MIIYYTVYTLFFFPFYVFQLTQQFIDKSFNRENFRLIISTIFLLSFYASFEYFRRMNFEVFFTFVTTDDGYNILNQYFPQYIFEEFSETIQYNLKV